jgi:hypothetical protein
MKFELEEWFINRKRLQKVVNDIGKNFDSRIKESIFFLKIHEEITIPTMIQTYVTKAYYFDIKDYHNDKTVFGNVALFIKIYKGCGEEPTTQRPWKCEDEVEIFFHWCDGEDTLAKGIIEKEKKNQDRPIETEYREGPAMFQEFRKTEDWRKNSE